LLIVAFTGANARRGRHKPANCHDFVRQKLLKTLVSPSSQT
jgi:hypothetical protein